MNLSINTRSWTAIRDRWYPIFVIAAVLIGAAFLGLRASSRWASLLALGLLIPALLRNPALGLPGLVLAALALPVYFGTGTEVSLNAVTLAIPALTGVWMLAMVVGRRGRLASSRANRPLLFFVVSGLLSLIIGLVIWDPMVPRTSNFILVQLAQWAIFALSGMAFWLTANLASEERWLRMMTWSFVLVGTTFAILRITPVLNTLGTSYSTLAFTRVPLWVLLAGVSGALLFFHDKLPLPGRIAAIMGVAVSLHYSFFVEREALSNWVGVSAALATLVWLRFPRLRWAIIAFAVILAMAGSLFPVLFEFAGGEAEWLLSGQSRIVLIERVIKVSMRNPITGIGPAAYRRYTELEPLQYGRAYWVKPGINSHNNYVDLFSQTGLLGLALIAWFVGEYAALGIRLRRRFTAGFASAYVNGMLAVGAASLVVMLLADWILPFVYNIGFGGFQASVLVWLFLGGLVALENMPVKSSGTPETIKA